MFDRVIVGVGIDHGRSRDAIALAMALGARRLTLVSAYPADPLAVSRLGEEYFGAIGDEALAGLERARSEMGVQAELLPVADLSPARALQHVAADRDASLIVVGSAHHGRVGRILAGDVTRGVLQDAPCPVAVAPAGFDQHRGELVRVAAGYDDAPESQAALDLATAFAAAHVLRLIAVTAWELPAVSFTGTAATQQVGAVADQEQLHVTNAVARAVRDVPEAEILVVRGTPAEVLTDATADVDLLVVGSRCWGTVHRVAMGSTSDHLMHHAACPLIVVPRPADAATAPAAGSAAAVPEGVA